MTWTLEFGSWRMQYHLMNHTDTNKQLIALLLYQVVYGENEIAYQIGETTEILSRGHLCATPHCVRVLFFIYLS